MFYEKYVKVTKEKSSIININLDPALPTQRKEYVIPDRFISKEDQETLLNFSLDIIEQVSDYCCCIKANTQYFLGHTNILKEITEKIHKEGMLAILDHKLSDIGSTNASAIYWIKEMDFDAFTFSPFAGNIKETVEKAHKQNLGVIVLTLMSNPEAKELMLDTKVDETSYYLHTSKTVKVTGADGCVVGLTGFIQDSYIRNIQEAVGENAILLLQGLGPQGGDQSKVKYVRNPLISLGRKVIYASNPKKVVKEYYETLNKFRR
jgi:orotidine-5'-phosphate decarboxylase